MKTIGFIDIHPQNRIHGANLSSGESDGNGEDASAVYLFRHSGRGYTYERTLNYDSPMDRDGIDAFYLSIPARWLNFRILNVPFPDKEKITGILPLELDNLVLGGSDEIIFDSIVIGGEEDSWEVLVIYIDRAALNRILAELAQKNVDPRVITSIDLNPIVTSGDARPGDFAENLTQELQHPQAWDERSRIQTAQRELSSPSINLRTGPLAYRKDAEKTGKLFKIAAVLALLLLLVVHANFLFQTFMIKKETSVLTEEMRSAYGSLFPNEKKTIDELYQLKSHMLEITEKDNELSGVRTLRFLLELSKRRGANVTYTDISIEKRLIKMKAETSSMGDLDKIKMKLSEFLPNVLISEVRPTSPGKVLFTVVVKDFIL